MKIMEDSAMPFEGPDMSPEVASLTQRVLKEITAQIWFSRSETNENEVVDLILKSYRGGMTDSGRLLNYCLLVAKIRFSD